MSWWANDNNDDGQDDYSQYTAEGGGLKKKIISLGLTKYEKDTVSGGMSIGNPQSPNREYFIKQEKMAMYRDQLERDKEAKIENTRKPLKQAPVYSDSNQVSYEGLRIGSDTQTNAVLDRKKEAQRLYQAQLAEDILAKKAFHSSTPNRGTIYKKKHEEVEPKPFSMGATVIKQQPSPRIPSYDYQGTGYDIGNNYSVEEQRSKALVHAAKLKEDILFKIKYSEPINEVMQSEYKRSSRKGQQDQETYEGFYIGQDAAALKTKKKAAQNAYYAELEAAHGPSQRPPKNRGLIDTEVNITGWTGLNIGGVANEQTRSRQALDTKVLQQERYRAQLQNQQATNELYKPKGDNFDPSAPLPYMKY